jgi:transcriptional regulator with XRE-family HTH domain
MEIYERIKQRRKEIGLSAEKVAEKLGISPATMYRYENNEIKKFPIDILKPLADVLHTTPSYLMGWTDIVSNIVLTPHEEQVISAYRNNPAMQDAVDKLLNVDDEIIASDIAQTIKSASKKGISVPTDKK